MPPALHPHECCLQRLEVRGALVEVGRWLVDSPTGRHVLRSHQLLARLLPLIHSGQRELQAKVVELFSIASHIAGSADGLLPKRAHWRPTPHSPPGWFLDDRTILPELYSSSADGSISLGPLILGLLNPPTPDPELPGPGTGLVQAGDPGSRIRLMWCGMMMLRCACRPTEAPTNVVAAQPALSRLQLRQLGAAAARAAAGLLEQPHLWLGPAAPGGSIGLRLAGEAVDTLAALVSAFLAPAQSRTLACAARPVDTCCLLHRCSAHPGEGPGDHQGHVGEVGGEHRGEQIGGEGDWEHFINRLLQRLRPSAYPGAIPRAHLSLLRSTVKTLAMCSRLAASSPAAIR